MITWFRLLPALLLPALLVVACGSSKSGGMSGPTMNNRVSQPTTESATLQSDDILAREPVANACKVRHILIGWGELAGAYGGAMDERAKDRSARDAEKLARSIYQRIQDGEPFESLMVEFSEDKGSATSGEAIDVSPDAPLVLDFKRLSLRLEVGEVGVVQTDFGWHIIKRVS